MFFFWSYKDEEYAWKKFLTETGKVLNFYSFELFYPKFEKIWMKPMKKKNKKPWMNKYEKVWRYFKVSTRVNNLGNGKENVLVTVKVQC